MKTENNFRPVSLLVRMASCQPGNSLRLPLQECKKFLRKGSVSRPMNRPTTISVLQDPKKGALFEYAPMPSSRVLCSRAP